jgi:hypothetical protein
MSTERTARRTPAELVSSEHLYAASYLTPLSCHPAA